MYKVFFNEKPIILTDAPIEESGYQNIPFDEINFPEISKKLRENRLRGIVLYHYDISYIWKRFTDNFIHIPAAGGLVINAKHEVLVIFRNNYWDLPKGKIDPGEEAPQTAVREVAEECGIGNLHIEQKIASTYHLFHENRDLKLKDITWFLMHTTDSSVPVPQREEGIEKAVFVNPDEIVNLLPTMHANISDMFENEIIKHKILQI